MPQKGDWMLPSSLFKGGGRIACSRMGAKVQSLLQVDGWMLNPAVLQGDLLPCSKKKEGYFKMQLHLQPIFPHTCGRLLQTSSCTQVASCQLVKKLLGCLHKKASAKQSRGG